MSGAFEISTQAVQQEIPYWTQMKLIEQIRNRKIAALNAVAIMVLLSGVCFAQPAREKYCPFLPSTPQTPGHPHPQPRPPASQIHLTQENGINVLDVSTGHGCFAEVDPYLNPPGTNFLPTIFTNAFDGSGNEMPNTLPSTPENPYNLHDGEPVVSRINPASPTDDLEEVFDHVEFRTNKAKKGPLNDFDLKAIANNLKKGVDILEGNPIANRLDTYSGLPLLHYKGPDKVGKVTAIKDQSGNVIGGNVNVHQVWFDTHIESDTAFIDPSDVLGVPWTITYKIDILRRGNDDFSPFAMYFDDPALTKPKPPMPHIAMDQTFYNMEEGTRTIFKIKMAPGKYYNLTYSWGWRSHPPRVQVTENANKMMGGKSLVQWEQAVFGGKTKAEAIAQIGALSPAKRMWAAFQAAQTALAKKDYKGVALRIGDARAAFRDWRDRTKLPRGIKTDPDADLTLLYVNNTIYGEFKDGSRIDFPQWTLRGAMLKVSLINGDYFDHAYQNVDFGGARGWENQFQSSVKSGGSGCWFTFGRVHWWMNIPMMTPDGQPFMVMIPAAKPDSQGQDVLGRYKVNITYNYEPSRRLRFYQFDPVHHDVAIFSIH
jgi:hypothetical protein